MFSLQRNLAVSTTKKTKHYNNSRMGSGASQMTKDDLDVELAKPVDASDCETLEQAQNEIKRAGIDSNLTYGVVLTGGGAQLRNIVPLATELLNMPIRLGKPENYLNGNKDFADEPVHSTVLGLLLWPLLSKEQKTLQYNAIPWWDSIKQMFKELF